MAMHAIAFTAYGGPEVVQRVQVPKPEAGAGEVLIKVSAAGVNPIDIVERGGRDEASLGNNFPLVAGNELAGVVEAVGSGVSNFSVGDRVMARTVYRKMGAFAEYSAVDAGIVAKSPTSLSDDTAAGIPLAGLTAFQGLEKLGVTSGDSILITGASGGVGLFAIQLAKARGATVAVTASPAGKPYVDKAGADEVIDYRSTKVSSLGQRWTKVFDLVGNHPDVLAVTKPGGAIVTTHMLTDNVDPKDVSLSFMAMKPNGPQLAELAKLADQGKLEVAIDSTFGVDQYKDALARVESGRSKGKVIIKFDK